MDFFPLLIYSKRQTPLLLDCEHSVPFCGCWGWHGSNGMLRLQFRCGAPSLLLAALRAPEHKDTSGGVCSSWEFPSVFLVGFVCLFLYFSLFLVCLPMPCVPRTKVPAGMHCSVPKAVGSCTELRRVGLGNWEEWALSRGGFYNGKSWNFKQSELKLGARGIYLT